MKYFNCLFLLIFFVTKGSAMDYSVCDFGAQGDGQTINTAVIQKVIDLCSEKGGRVIVPKGKYLTGTLFLKSNVTLHLERGALLLGSTNLKDYPKTTLDFRFWGDTWTFYSLIVGHNIENVTIEGDGTIDGQGGLFAVVSKKKPDKYKDRPYLLWFANSKNIQITGVELRNSAMWMQSYIRCEQLKIDGVRIFNHSNLNNDMIDIDGCKDVVITRVVGDSDDDGITFKSTCDRMSENIIVSDCSISSHCNALKFGTETTTGFKNVVVNNCIIRKSSVHKAISGAAEGVSGISLEIVDGGILENATFTNIVIDGQQVPLFVRLGNRARKYYQDAPEPPIGKMRNILFSNITARASTPIGCSIMGIPNGMIDGLTISNSHFICTGGGANNLNEKKIEELESLYPEATMFGSLPSYGLYLRHAKNIQLQSLSFELLEADDRPAIMSEDVQNLDMQSIMVNGKSRKDNIVLQ